LTSKLRRQHVVGIDRSTDFQGHVATTQDALMLFEACLQGHLSYLPRRPHDRERNQLICSGCVFIYEEDSSGIKRWTDGVTWSPSRVLGNFLVYRELDKPFPPGEKKRANKAKKRRPSQPGDPYARPDGSSNEGGYSPTTPQSSSFGFEKSGTEMERQLIGSLIDSYGFKADGLVKNTMSVTVQGVTHHLVSYYNVTDVLNNQLRTPTQTENLHYIRPRPELTSKSEFPILRSKRWTNMRAKSDKPKLKDTDTACQHQAICQNIVHSKATTCHIHIHPFLRSNRR
jgi:Gti1/Pac2 family transcription factor